MVVSAGAQTGPYPPDDWPSVVNPDATVHYISVGDTLAPPGFGWTPDLNILSDGDQVTADVTLGGYPAKKAVGNFLNVADYYFEEWADDEYIDILVNAWGDAALFDPSGEPRNFHFLLGTLPDLSDPVGGQVPVEARNRKWNWLLFRVPNDFRPDGLSRYVGSIPDNATGNFSAGGVNGGTIRFQSVPNLTVRAIAFGELGAFGEPENYTQFEAPAACDPEPETNLASLDIDSDTSDHLVVINEGDQTVVFEDNVGPEGDRRRVVRPEGLYLNFGITDNYLGAPCSDPRTVKVCVEFYDDPEFAGFGVRFGPEAYATDDQGGIGFFPENQRHELQGTGEWIRRSWLVPAVSLYGVNAGQYTAGPRFISENGSVAVSSIRIAVLRIGDHPLAGQDPIPDCYQDFRVCTGEYGNFAELDLASEIRNGIDVGSSGGDQEMIVEEAGPENDRRMAVRPAFDDGTPGFNHHYLNFAITDEVFGPSSQDPAHLAICVTYYDDPELAGESFRPEVYQTERNGQVTLAFPPSSIAKVLQGSGEWRQAYWEIPDMKFLGVNQGPQAAARFVATAKIFVSAVRYGVIRTCGPDAGVNPLEDCKPVEVTLTASLTDSGIELRWPAGSGDFTVESTTALGTTWEPVDETPTVDGTDMVLTVTPAGTTFYRLVQP